ncbi:hypothetical protein [Enhygromyxa salina]|uniref:hypothetical protein n=1 Tax=Enhygromyxa salina TaxID=215803 RepID=UPI0011B28D41|nr:hypothetical protein [Enhygromyxa salina]
MRASTVRAAVVVSLTTCAASGAGCGGSTVPEREQAAPADRAAAVSESQALDSSAPAPSPVAEALAPNSFEPLSDDQLARAHAAVETHLNAGRAAIEAIDLATGIGQLQAAAAISPTDATILRALGWAHFDAHQLAEAEHVLDRALHHARDPDTRAAVLYELGRVAEARADVPVASERYTDSLAIRPDESVAARLVALTGGTEVISHTACGWTRHGPAPAQLCPAYLRTREPGRAASACAYETTRAVAGPRARESGAATVDDLELDGGVEISVFSYLEPGLGGAREIFVLNAVLDGVWYSGELTWVDHPGASYADEALAKLQLRTEQLAPGGLPELVIEWSVQGRAIDPGAEVELSWSVDRLGVLMLQSGSPRWLIGLNRASTASIATIGGEAADLSSTGLEIEWLPKTGEVELRAATNQSSAPARRYALGAAPQLCPAELDGSS